MNNQKLSFEMAERLKALREARGLSHNELSTKLYMAYSGANDSKPENKRRKRKKTGKKEADGVKQDTLISRDSLINYEVSVDYHEKAYTNEGMCVEYLRYLSDFYNVSSDYILGLSDVASPDISVNAICGLTRIPEEMAINFVNAVKNPSIHFFMEHLLNTPLETLEKISNKYCQYSTYIYAMKPSIEAKKDELANKKIYSEFVVNGEEMPRVPLNKMEEYIKFELWNAFNEFLTTRERDTQK